MDIVTHLTTHLRSAMAEGNGNRLSIQYAAASLALTERTLQRRLAQFDLSYSKLRDQVRLEETCRLLQRPDVRLIDVAYQLGFSDPGHFSRAFRGWTGMPPRRFRQRMRRFPEHKPGTDRCDLSQCGREANGQKT